MIRTYGYGNQVGDWMGTCALIPHTEGHITSLLKLLAEVRAALQQLNQVVGLQLSWTEPDAMGAPIVHELEDVPAASWDDVGTRIEEVAARGEGVAIEAVVVMLSTRVIEPNGELWLDRSATLILSIHEPSSANTVEVEYTTYTDAWLSTTYGDDGILRSNHLIADLNRPVLAEALRGLRALTLGSRLRTGKSDLYPFALTEDGFVDVDNLVTR